MGKILTKVSLIFIFIFSISFANEIADSLLNKVDNTQGIENIHAKLDYSFYLRRTDTDLSKEYAEAALKEIRKKFNNKDLEAKAIYYLGLPYYYAHDYDIALELFYESIAICKNTNNNFLLSELYFFVGATHYFHYGDNKQTIKFYNMSIDEGNMSQNYRMLGAAYSSLSSVYRTNNSYDRALEYAYFAKENYRLGNYREGLAWVAYTMGSLYSSVELYNEAQNYLSEALAEYKIIAKENQNNTGVAICLDQLTRVHNELGNVELARKYNNESLTYYKKENSLLGLSIAYRYRGKLEYNEGNYLEAMKCLDSSNVLKTKLSDKIGQTSLYLNYGEVLIALNELDAAEDSLMLALQNAIKYNHHNSKIDIYNNLSIIYSKRKDYKNSLYFKDKEVTVSDSLYAARITRNMGTLQSLYEIESKERAIAKLEVANEMKEAIIQREVQIRRMLILVLFTIFALLVLLVYFFREKTKTNKELAQSKKYVDEVNATKDKFFSIIAHDLKGPFSSILGLSSLMAENFDKFDQKKNKELIDAINHSSKTSFDLLNNLLEWSRTQTNTIPFVPEVLDVDSLLENIKELMNSNLETKNINLNLNLHGAKMFADMNMMHTVIRNLVSNAIKYSKYDSKIIINYELKANCIEFSVKDHGIGINKNNINRLFKVDDPFYSDGTAGEKGTGLGLIITKEFIEKHEGNIWVESTPGRGSTFYFSIPNK